jgi:glucosyl-3-phosphoglycerate synthase
VSFTAYGRLPAGEDDRGVPTGGPDRGAVLGAGLPDPNAGIRAVVVIPARDEAERIAACLFALAAQRGIAHDEYEAIVVLDGCRDDTLLRVREVIAAEPTLQLHVIATDDSRGVGRARRSGMDLACQRLLRVGNGAGLIASTDADSVVADDWLAAQLELAGSGAQAIGGHVELHHDDSQPIAEQAIGDRDRRAVQRLRTVLAHDARDAGKRLCSDGPEPSTPAEHHHFSGASLSLTADTYRRCGGLPARAALEDEALERELRAGGVQIHRSRRVRVSTSARTDGRTPRGLSQDLARADWRARRSYSATEFPLARLLRAKQASVALVLPAREVAATIGPIAEHAARLRDAGLLDELLVVDSRSRDGSADVAERAGLTVVQEDELHAELGPARGKGDAMWRALAQLDSDIVAFADTDTEDFGEHFLTGLLGPLICEPQVQLVKGRFRRPFRSQGGLAPHGGGRVTELMARPLLNLHAPELAVFDQPLAGETAARRELLRQIPFSAGYGVEIAMLIDAWRIAGLDGLAQVDLGVRQNRHQSLRELSAMSYAVLVAAQTRFLGPEFADQFACGSLSLPVESVEGSAIEGMESRQVTIDERPPLAAQRRISKAAPRR